MKMDFEIPLVESSVELLEELETIDEFESSEIFEGFEGESRFIMCPLDGTTCCSIELRLDESGGEVDETCMGELDILAGTSETSVEPSALVIRLWEDFMTL